MHVVTGDVLQAADIAPLRQRNAKSCCRALRRADAGDDLDPNPGSMTGGDLLAGAGENEGVAALEPHHPPARFGKRDHQRVDLVLLASCPVAGLADQHLFRLAPRKVENFRRNQVIDQDDVRRLQRPQGAQRE